MAVKRNGVKRNGADRLILGLAKMRGKSRDVLSTLLASLLQVGPAPPWGGAVPASGQRTGQNAIAAIRKGGFLKTGAKALND